MKLPHMPAKKQRTDPLEPIPCGESVETDWAAWEETLASQQGPSDYVQVVELHDAGSTFSKSAWASL